MGRLFKEQNRLHPGYGFSQGMKSIDWWSMIVKALLNENSRVKKQPLLSNEMLDKMSVEIFNEFSKAECWQKYEHCDSILANLKSRNFKLGVISNFDERLFNITKELDIDSYFDFLLIPANSGGSYKPQRDIFERAFKSSKVNRPESVVHVGDNLELDYLAARDSNFKSILVFHKPPSATDLEDPRIKKIIDEGNFANDLRSLQEIICKT
jgi:REG-2-like HAD superfamily hydrolase